LAIWIRAVTAIEEGFDYEYETIWKFFEAQIREEPAGPGGGGHHRHGINDDGSSGCFG
jgi:hypothetical protein